MRLSTLGTNNGTRRVVLMSRHVSITPFLVTRSDAWESGRYNWMTSPATDDHGVGREYQVPSWLNPIYTQTQRTVMGRVRPRRGHPFLKFHPQTKEFEWLGDQPLNVGAWHGGDPCVARRGATKEETGTSAKILDYKGSYHRRKFGILWV
ncbi:hypothetical protein F2Q69_00024345 [Brassica cretica]|uniref:Uncharacterized protein n=1 Tax=Brassica cretica TaxID=69181 RepID=A0A8S9Q7N6_BRACR|nr:hypothetical protein F2Q69_00024345 [Brassica cretica]